MLTAALAVITYIVMTFSLFALLCCCCCCLLQVVANDSLQLQLHQLDLPSYSSIDVMREKVLMAIREGSQGFGFR